MQHTKKKKKWPHLHQESENEARRKTEAPLEEKDSFPSNVRENGSSQDGEVRAESLCRALVLPSVREVEQRPTLSTITSKG
jgi:hypothetical protein